MTRSIALVVIAIVLIGPIRAALVRARWTELTPRAAIVLWQSIALAFVVALFGACFALTSSTSSGPSHRRSVTDFTHSLATAQTARHLSPSVVFGLSAGLVIATLLIGCIVFRSVGLFRARAHHRLLIDLLGTERAGMPGTVVLDHPRATAFSLPGLRPRIVVSSGAIDALQCDELAAVLAHERAHLRSRHDLLLLPFWSFYATLPRCRALSAVKENVTTLVEMAADDRALRECEPAALSRAICRLAATDGALGNCSTAANSSVRRVERVLARQEREKLAAVGSACSALAVVALPVLVLLAPLGAR